MEQQLALAKQESELSAAVFRGATQAPPARATKRPRHVMEEDDFEDAVNAIIQRDFFPDLPRLRAERDFLAAQSSGNPQLVAEALQRLQEAAATPSRRQRSGSEAGTPARAAATPGGEGFDTPQVHGAGGARAPTGSEMSHAPLRERTKYGGVDVDMPLDAFLLRHTSEDNESFHQLLDRQNEQKRAHYKWLYEEQDRRQNSAGQHLLMAADERDGVVGDWKYKPQNQLMYIPDGVGSVADATTATPKAINRTATRFTSDGAFKIPLMPASRLVQQQTQQAEGVGRQDYALLDNLSDPSRLFEAIRNRDSAGAAKRSFNLDDFRKTPLAAHAAEGLAAAAPNTPLRGYSFLATPSPMVVSGVEAGASPIVTWGEIASTPLVLSGGAGDATPGRSFQLAPERPREQLALALADRQARAHKPPGPRADKKEVARRILAAHSPQVASGIGLRGSGAAGAGIAGPADLRASYRSPAVRTSSAATPTRSALGVPPPSPSPSIVRAATPKKTSITEGLLK
eukprot:TRINITY_DN6212_c0_g1_i1.p1 TRINITY_DN6212_c0_g1~~TRINITY_DN6212_c0_g1_i1.p1  ORF type:complete len:514 (+),score=109.02 TRINITY_DN6212_c0_g1_i1:63-1604(+)